MSVEFKLRPVPKHNKIYVVDRSHTVEDRAVKQMFKDNGYEVVNSRSDKFDIVCFTGGEDICPFLYGEKPIASVYFNAERDLDEVRFMKNLSDDIYKLGICRGGQLLNVVMNNGSMWQDIDGHTGQPHLVEFDPPEKEADKQEITVNSYHHQLMIPGPEAWTLGWAAKSSSRRGFGKTMTISRAQPEKNSLQEKDAEIIYYWNTNTLCFQPHPEYTAGETRDTFFKLCNWMCR